MVYDETTGQKFDIGIVGWWYYYNYGSILTYLALCKALESKGFSVLMIRKVTEGKSGLENQLPENAIKRYCTISKFYNKNTVAKLNSICDSFISGSDQMWNPYCEKDAGEQYFLDFVDDNHKKISYASSVGNATDAANEFKEKYRRYVQRFSAVSVREHNSIAPFQTIYGILPEHVCDPVFLCDKNVYFDILQKSRINISDKYLLCFILDPTEEKKEIIKKISSELKLKVICLVDLTDAGKKAQAFDAYECYPYADIEDFLYLFKNAQYIITDSFHGTCFSIIFEKNFSCIPNYQRGDKRVKELLNLYGLKDRIVESEEDISEYTKYIDYLLVNQIIEREKNRSWEWLLEKLKKTDSLSVRETVDFDKQCVGCSACANICPVNAIKMISGKYGYYIPKVVTETCINCGACTKVCPALKIRKNINDVPECYEFQARNNEILYASSSGGFFSTLANKILNKQGVVYGAAWGDKFSVKHVMIDSITEIGKLQKSKYLQSFIDEHTFKDIKNYLQDGKNVMFTGCPCQVAGLKNFLGKEYDNLLLIDIFCGGAPSVLFFQMYLKDDIPKNIAKYEFRSKQHGWNCECEEITLDNGEKVIRYGKHCDEYQRVYHNHTMCSYHCEKCKYQSFPRLGDITIGDFWRIDKYDKAIETQKGVSAVLINNDKGHEWFESISDKEAEKKKASVEWLEGNGNYKGNWAGAKRDLFYEAILKKGFHEAADYALKPNHGNYRGIYAGNDTLLQYDRMSYNFSYNPTWWEQHVIDGCLTLIAKPGASSKPGRYAVLQLGRELNKKCRYRFSIRYKIKSDSDIINFHIKDSGSLSYQVITSENIKARNNGTEWLETSVEFVPNANIYDEFMIGAAQVSGNNSYISFAYINIVKVS